MHAEDSPIQKSIKEAVDLLESRFGRNIRAIVLFGSHARIEGHAESDYDFLLIIDGLPVSPLQRMRLVRSVLVASSIHINTVIMTSQEFEADLAPLKLDICTDGICLSGSEYFEPFRTRAIAAIKSAGLRRKRYVRDFLWQFESPPQKTWELNWTGFHEST